MVQAPNRIISSQEAELWSARTCLRWKSALAAAVVRPCLQGIGNWAVTAHLGQYFSKRPPSERRAHFSLWGRGRQGGLVHPALGDGGLEQWWIGAVLARCGDGENRDGTSRFTWVILG